MKLFLRYFILISISLITLILLGLYFVGSSISETVISEKKMLLKNYNKLIHVVAPKKSDLSIENNYLKILAENLEIRITAIEKDGRVFYDSTFFDDVSLKNIENHLGRKEIDDAISKGEGTDIRVSSTVGVSSLYYAKLIDSDYVLRVSFSFRKIENYIVDFKYHIIAIFTILVTAVIVLSYYFSKRLSLPVENLNDMINKIEKGDNIELENYYVTSDEISKLIYRLYNNMNARENALLEEKKKMNFILSSLTDGVALLTDNWVVLYRNDKYIEMFGNDATDIFNELKDFESLKLFNDLKQKGDGKHFIKYKNKFYEVILKSYNKYKILVFHDSSDQMRYHAFKSELIANISHELKTPVSIIMGYSETLMNSDIDASTREKFSKKLYESSLRLDNLITDIIQLHSLESSGRNLLVEKGINIGELKHELEEIYKDSVKNISFAFDDAYVGVLKEHILSIYKNLIDNAITYSMGENVYVGFKKAGEKLILTVDDEGPVISDDEKGKIFERFYTTSKSRNKKNSGTGLGLSIVKHTSEIYNGYVELIKGIYGGNCFKVVLSDKLSS
ncbi:MAG: HAMP domain-containing histidine kinase [Calditerrivibrio sp.]|nr:HAMP domain-containing histidine kinase [Calditerrivibrio sp.]MCA1932972.1 HAMP domain-containing histidine kinase [Calditerrivibrio sp.]